MANLGNTVIMLSFLFMIGCMAGWVIELVFRKFFGAHNPDHKWINPGFLIGPYLPLYGFGLVVLFMLSLIPYLEFSGYLPKEGWARSIVTIVIIGISLTVLEYIAGIIFIKGMHVRLWDYSKCWGNIQGIICPRFSLFWTLGGAGYYFLLRKPMIKLALWIIANKGFCLIIGMIYGIFLVDVFYSFQLVAKIRRFAAEKQIVVRYEELKATIRQKAEDSKDKVYFLFLVPAEKNIHDILHRYAEKLEGYADKLEEYKEEYKEKLEEYKEGYKEKLEEYKDKIEDFTKDL